MLTQLHHRISVGPLSAIRSSGYLSSEFDKGIETLLDRLRASNDGDAEQFLTEWAEFIFEYGSRGPNEYEIIADSWETKPEIALALLDRIRLQHDDENPPIVIRRWQKVELKRFRTCAQN